MYLSIVVWKLRPGKTHEDFVQAWYPDKASDLPATVYLGTNISNEHEVVVMGLHDTDMTREELARILLQATASEVARSKRIAEVVEPSRPGSMFEVRGVYDLTTDAAVDAGRV
jgi:hypothetical protein